MVIGQLKKKKKISCEICVNKKFTTKRSLERHNNTFHVKKHSIKDTQVIPKVIYPNTTSPETVKAEPETVKAEERKSKNLKRKFQYNPGEFHLVRDNQPFSRDEQVIKQPKGVDSKVPKRTKIKRKFDDSSGGLERRVDDDDDVIMESAPAIKLPISTKKKAEIYLGIILTMSLDVRFCRPCNMLLTGPTQVNDNNNNFPQSGPALQGCTVNVPYL